jgi:hypothetical protein
MNHTFDHSYEINQVFGEEVWKYHPRKTGEKQAASSNKSQLGAIPGIISVSSPCHFQLKVRTGQMLPELSANRVKEIFIYNPGERHGQSLF